MSKLERPVCQDCAKEMTCAKNGFLVVSENGRKAWGTDRYECVACGFSVAVGSSEGFVPSAGDLARARDNKEALRLKESE